MVGPARRCQVAITGIVERLGPVVGGVLGCVPHVAVVGSVGFILQTDSPEEFRSREGGRAGGREPAECGVRRTGAPGLGVSVW